MRSRYEHQGIVWIDLESPSREEVQGIVDQFAVAPLVAEELLLPSAKPRVEFHTGYAYLVLHFPALRHTHRTREQEVDFIIGKNFLITTRYDTVDPLHKFSKVFETSSMLGENALGDHAGFIFFYMLKKLYKSVEHEVEYVRHDLNVIEEHLFSGRELELVAELSRAARDLLSIRQVIEPHREVLREMEESGKTLFGKDFLPYLRSLSNEYYRVHNHVMREIESLRELRETNNSLLNTKQNETMRIFTVLAFFTFPLSLIAALFSMDAHYEPIVGTPYDFWIILGLMAIVSLGMFSFFKYKRWF